MEKDTQEFDLNKTLKTKPEDSFFNVQSLLYVTANQITKGLYYTGVSPHQVIFISMLFGIAASFLLIQENKLMVVLGAVLLFYKNVLDKVDGSLARAKGLDSRRGRFYDSLADFVVTLFVFTLIGYKLTHQYPVILVVTVVFLAMICSMLQCSYFIYYQVSFIKITGKHTINRIIETVTDEDRKNEDKFTLFLHKIFVFIYGWQDIVFGKLDKYFLNKLKYKFNNELLEKYWYRDKYFLTIASFLSIGSHMVLIAVFSILNLFGLYLFLNLLLFNLFLIYSTIYHYKSTKNRIKDINGASY